MLLGCIADDFTGASDVANTLSRGGMRTRLFVGVDGATEDCEAGVVALKTRSMPKDAAIEQSLNALKWLLAAGCRQIVFKYCSTFDSTAEGNIGPVAQALAEALGARGVVVCPAFPGAGRTVYQGHLFVGDRLLSQSGMERHPLTPMTDPDIRRWLGLQSRALPGHVARPTVKRGAEAVRQALEASPETLVVVDAIDDDDLRTIGKAVAGARLLTGGSGIALELPENFRRDGLIEKAAPAFVGETRRAIILSGSCSVATRAQVARYRALHPSFEIDIDQLLGGQPVGEHIQAFIQEHADRAPLIFSSDEPERVQAAQQAYGAERCAVAVERLFGAIATEAVEADFGRIVVAGGETSGAVVKALGLTSLEIGPEIDPGVPALATQTKSGRRIALALKSGNFGGDEFLAKAVSMLGVSHA